MYNRAVKTQGTKTAILAQVQDEFQKIDKIAVLANLDMVHDHSTNEGDKGKNRKQTENRQKSGNKRTDRETGDRAHASTHTQTKIDR